MPVGSIHVNDYFEEHCRRGSLGRKLLAMLKKRGRELRTLDPTVREWNYGGARFELLSPLGPTVDDGEVGRPALGSNDSSTVMRVTFAGHSILLTGDIEEHTQSALLEGADLRADVLLLPHHGSVCATTEAFIAATGAQMLIRSSRERTSQTFNGLTELVGDAFMLNTADVGAVTVEIDAAGVHVRSERSVLRDAR